MNEYIYKSFNYKFESYKPRDELVNNIQYFNDIDYANMDPTNVGQHLELSYIKNINSNSERNPYLQNMTQRLEGRLPGCSSKSVKIATFPPHSFFPENKLTTQTVQS
jgi:hypothetical protein